MRFYFAYGSNLNWIQMSLRCPTAVPMGQAKLKGYKLTFKHYADIVKGRGPVRGGLWVIHSKDEIALDKYEGVNTGLYQRKIVDVWYKGYKIQALTYIMTDITRTYKKPMDTYIDIVREGYRDFGIDLKYLEKILD